MKKALSLLLLMACAALTNAQNISIIVDGTTLQNGDTVTVQAGGIADQMQDGTPFHQAEFSPVFHNSSIVVAPTVRIYIEKLNNSTAEVATVCASVCVSGGLSAPFILPANQDYNGAYAHFNVPDDAETGIFRFTLYDTNNTSNEAYCFLKVEKYASTNGIEKDITTLSTNAYPNPATSTVTISCSAEQNCEVVITNLLGIKVKEAPLTNGTATIDLNGLPSGIYLYGIKTNGVMSATKKLVVNP